MESKRLIAELKQAQFEAALSAKIAHSYARQKQNAEARVYQRQAREHSLYARALLFGFIELGRL